MGKLEYIMLFVFVLLIFAFGYYFIYKNSCEPVTQCTLPSINKSCASYNDCFSGSIRGNCDLKTFKCVNLVLEGDKEDCLKANGTWYEEKCGL